MNLGFKAKVPGCHWSPVKHKQKGSPAGQIGAKAQRATNIQFLLQPHKGPLVTELCPHQPTLRVLGHPRSTVVTPAWVLRGWSLALTLSLAYLQELGHRYIGMQFLLLQARLLPWLGHTLDKVPGLQVGSSRPLQMPLQPQD